MKKTGRFIALRAEPGPALEDRAVKIGNVGGLFWSNQKGSPFVFWVGWLRWAWESLQEPALFFCFLSIQALHYPPGVDFYVIKNRFCDYS